MFSFILPHFNPTWDFSFARNLAGCNLSPGKAWLSFRPGNNSGLTGILGFGSEIFCENPTQEIVIVHCESLESELLAEKK